eukprot:7988976-Pyramimonas_sp.AAC.1
MGPDGFQEAAWNRPEDPFRPPGGLAGIALPGGSVQASWRIRSGLLEDPFRPPGGLLRAERAEWKDWKRRGGRREPERKGHREGRERTGWR